MTLFCITIF